jgi:peptidoglycan/xylan/chitin deacetylase (PgdA/CDA1 family)
MAACFGLLTLTAQAASAKVVDGVVIMRQPMRENLCAITFDDGPSVNTPQLLDMLAEYGIPATFFLLGSQAERHPDIVRRILAEGHEVGNHSYSHPNLRLLSPERKTEEICRTDAILRSLGAAPVFLRPPYGAFDAYTEKVAAEQGLTVLLWSLDSRDWQRLPANYATLRSTLGTVYQPGTLRGVFLFHDTHKRTVDDLPRIIRDLRAGGCQRFVTVSDYLEGLLDPEPGLLMTRQTPHALPPGGTEMPVAAHEVRGVREAEELPTSSYPAGSTPVPLARSSRPWPWRDAPAAEGPQTAEPQTQTPQADKPQASGQADSAAQAGPARPGQSPAGSSGQARPLDLHPHPASTPASGLTLPAAHAESGPLSFFFLCNSSCCASPHRHAPPRAPAIGAGALLLSGSAASAAAARPGRGMEPAHAEGPPACRRDGP